jgi:hypothetical protein
MAIVVSEKYKGRTRDVSTAEIVYIVQGTGVDAGTISDEDAFDQVAASAPNNWDGIPGANINVRQELVQDTIWEVAVTYGGESGDSLTFPQSTVDYEFSFQAPSEKIYQSLETIGVYDADGSLDPDFSGGAINVTNDGGEIKVEGLDLPPGTPTNTWVFKPLAATITDAYQIGVEGIMGHVNAFAFKNRQAGTMRFVTCDGGAIYSAGTIAKWQIRYGFQFSAHRSNFTAGGIPVPFKGGHHLMWSYYKEEQHDPANDPVPNAGKAEIIKRPKYIFVERVFHESNFNVLGI